METIIKRCAPLSLRTHPTDLSTTITSPVDNSHSLLYATIDGQVYYVETLQSPDIIRDEGTFVTWFRAVQTLPPHLNVLPYEKFLVAASPGAGAPAVAANLEEARLKGLTSDGHRLHMVARVPAGPTSMVSLSTYLEMLREQQQQQGTGTQGKEDFQVPESMVRCITGDALYGLYHLASHGLNHRHLTPDALLIDTATGAAQVGALGFSLCTYSGAAALTREGAVNGVTMGNDVVGLGNIVLALATGEPGLFPVSSAPNRESAEAVVAHLLCNRRPYSADLIDFAATCLSPQVRRGRAALDELMRHPFLHSLIVAEVHRARQQRDDMSRVGGNSTTAPAAGAPAVGEGAGPTFRDPGQAMQPDHPAKLYRGHVGLSPLLPLLSVEPPQQPYLHADSITSAGSAAAAGLPQSHGLSAGNTPVMMSAALPQTTAGLSADGFTVHTPTQHGVRVMKLGAALPKRQQYYYTESVGPDGGEPPRRRYMAGYGLLFELEVHSSVLLEDVFFQTVGDISSLHVQLYWRPGTDMLRDGGSVGRTQGDGHAWVPVLHRPKHLRKVRALKPLSVGPFSLRLPFVDRFTSAGRCHNRHAFLLITNYAYGVRFYGVPHGLLGQPVGAPLDSDGVLTVTTGIACGEDVCVAVSDGALRPQKQPDEVDGDDSEDSDAEVEDPREVQKQQQQQQEEEWRSSSTASNACATAVENAAALSRSIEAALERLTQQPVECPSGLYGSLKYVAIS